MSRDRKYSGLTTQSGAFWRGCYLMKPPRHLIGKKPSIKNRQAMQQGIKKRAGKDKVSLPKLKFMDD